MDLPDTVKSELEHAYDHSRSAARALAIYLATALYVSVAALGVSDRDIVLLSGARLPIVNISVSLKFFFMLAPLFLIILYVHFQVYYRNYQRAFSRWAEMGITQADLRPWYVSMPSSDSNVLVSFLHRYLSHISLWWSLPIALYVIAGAILRLHDECLIKWTLFAAFLGTVIAFVYYHGSRKLAFSPAKAREKREAGFMQYVDWGKKIIGWLYLRVILIAIWLFVAVIPFIFYFNFVPLVLSGWPNPKEGLEENLRPFTMLSLRNELLVSRPSEEYRGRMWWDFRHRRFEGGSFIGCVFGQSDLSWARFDNAELNYSYMIGVDANNTYFTGASLLGTRLQNSDLLNARFGNADLKKTIFAGAIVDSVDFSRSSIDSNYFEHLRSWKNTQFPAHTDTSRIGKQYDSGLGEEYTKIGTAESRIVIMSVEY